MRYGQAKSCEVDRPSREYSQVGEKSHILNATEGLHCKDRTRAYARARGSVIVSERLDRIDETLCARERCKVSGTVDHLPNDNGSVKDEGTNDDRIDMVL